MLFWKTCLIVIHAGEANKVLATKCGASIAQIATS